MGIFFISAPLDGVFAASLFLGVCKGFWWPSRVYTMGGKPMFTRVTRPARRQGDFGGCGALLITFPPLSTVLPRGRPTSDYPISFPGRTREVGTRLDDGATYAGKGTMGREGLQAPSKLCTT